MAKVTQVQNDETGLAARTAYNEAIKNVEVESATLNGDGIVTPLSVNQNYLLKAQTQETGNTLNFTKGLTIGTSLTPISGDLTIDILGGEPQTGVLVWHQQSTAPLISGSGATVSKTIGTYIVNTVNLILVTYLGNGEFAINYIENIDLTEKANKHPTIRTVSTTNDTLTLNDDDGVIRYINANPISVLVPLNSNVQFKDRTVISIEQSGAGVVTLTPEAGVTLNSNLNTGGQYKWIQLFYIGSDVWSVIGGV